MSDQPSNVQRIHDLEDNLDNIRYAKTQQWQVGSYTLLIFGALIAAKDNVTFLDKALICLTYFKISLIATAAAGLWFVLHFQNEMKKLRKKSDEIECKLEFLRENNACCKKHSNIFRDGGIPLLILLSIAFGFCLAWNWN